MPAGHLASDFRRRLIVDAFVGDIPRRRLRMALDDDALYPLVDGLPVLCWSTFSRHMPASLAFAVSALTAAAEPPFSDIEQRLHDEGF